MSPLDPVLEGKVTFYGINQGGKQSLRRRIGMTLDRMRLPPHSRFVQKVQEWTQGGPRAKMLERIIRKIQPDFIHSMEMQRAGYMLLETRERMGDAFPPWMHSNWGSDIYIYHRVAEHRERVLQVLQACDFFTADCRRDVALAQRLGLRARTLPALSAAGGMDADALQPFRQAGPSSSRKVILLKGYQHWVGRALVGLRAIELCADVIRARGYRVLIHLASPDVKVAAGILAKATGIPIDVVLHDHYLVSGYEESLRRMGSARIYIGLSISDGAPQSLFEAMALGTFPIQSCTACADEWIEDGKSGFIVPPEDPHVVAAALRRALVEDDLVDTAAAVNLETIRQRLDYAQVKQQVIDIYQSVYAAVRAMQSGGRDTPSR